MIISLIVAMSKNRGIGKNNRLPWRLPAEQQHFKQVTMGHHVIMGRKTYQSIGRPLPGRENIVVSSNPAFFAPGCQVVPSVKEAYLLALAKKEAEAFNIGGGMLYQHGLPFTQRIYLTTVHTITQADTFFPEIDPDEWMVIEEWDHPKDQDNQFPFSFKLLIRKTSAEPVWNIK